MSAERSCWVALTPRLGQRSKYVGTFERYRTKTGYTHPVHGYRGDIVTVLLVDITDDSGNVVADHLWLNLTKALEAASLNPGDKVSFFAKVEQYTKGYFGRRSGVNAPPSIDYRLTRPTRVEVVSRANDGRPDDEVA